MAIKKVDSGYRVDFRPRGSTKRIRRIFKTKSEAVRYQAWIENNLIQNPEWQPKTKDTRRLSELVRKWRQLHGQTLRDGDGRLQMLHATCRRWGDPVAIEITKTSYLEYRAKRLKDGIKPRTLNHELTYIRAVFNELERLDEWQHGNPLDKVRKLKVDEDELTYLSIDEIKSLLREVDVSRNKDLALIVRICLGTGARWSEAECLRAEQVRNHRITYTHTKSRKNRSIPIPDDLFKRIKNHSDIKHGRLFRPSIEAFKEALKRTDIVLPRGQLTHVLRHSFASHFMINGGDIITLQHILGHSTITMTMRYAHLSPGHLQDAVKKSPLALV